MSQSVNDQQVARLEALSNAREIKQRPLWSGVLPNRRCRRCGSVFWEHICAAADAQPHLHHTRTKDPKGGCGCL